jgi:hypothetical protein
MKSEYIMAFSRVLRLSPDADDAPLSFKFISSGQEIQIPNPRTKDLLKAKTGTHSISDAEAMWNERRWYYASGLMNASTTRSTMTATDMSQSALSWDDYFHELEQAPRYKLSTTSPSFFDAKVVTAASANRRTWRSFSKAAITMDQLSIILSELCAGITGFPDFKSVFLTHIIVFRVDGLEPGIYALDPSDFSLVQVRKGDFNTNACQLLRGLIAPKSASVSLILSAHMKNLPLAYQPNASIRDMFTHAGFAMQKAIEVCTVFSLGTLPTPAMPDTDCANLLGVDGITCNPVYSLTIGTTPKESDGVGG